MRKIFVAFLLFALNISLSSSIAIADNTTIPIRNKQGSVIENGNHPPKAPAFIPMEVYYNSSMSALMFTFIADLGNVTVNVTNMSDGEWLEGTVNAQAGGTALFPMSGEAGLYILTITLQNGTEYEGLFDIE